MRETKKPYFRILLRSAGVLPFIPLERQAPYPRRSLSHFLHSPAPLSLKLWYGQFIPVLKRHTYIIFSEGVRR